MVRCVGGWMDGWMNGWLNELVAGWLGGWMDGTMNGFLSPAFTGWTMQQIQSGLLVFVYCNFSVVG